MQTSAMPDDFNLYRAPAVARFRFGHSAFIIPLLAILTFALPSSADDAAKQALDDARRLAREGKYEEALQKHVWFHDQALTIRPSYYGVRLSFALADWVDLGKQYPHALKVLRDIRDKKTSRLLDGETDHRLFHDVSAINKHLNDPGETAELFNKLDSRDSAFAAKVYHLADEALIDQKEFRLARKYLGDPEKRLSSAIKNHQRGIELSRKLTDDERSRSAFDQIFSGDVVRLITILRETGDRPRAEKIQAEALKTLDEKAIRDALGK